MITSQWQLISMGGALLCAVIGSIHDLRERRIPNLLTGPAIVAGLVLHACVGHWSGLADSALGGLIAGGIALIFFVAGGMGARRRETDDRCRMHCGRFFRCMFC